MTDLADELAEAIAGDAPDFDADPIPAETEEQANRYLFRIGRLDLEADEIRALAAAERERIDLWEAHRLEAIAKQRSWLTAACTSMLAAVRRLTNDKVKSLSLPNGEIVSTGQQPAWTYTDEAEFVSWAVDHLDDDCIRRPEAPPPAPDKATVKKRLMVPDGKPGDTVVPKWVDPETQELIDVPGVSVVYQEPKFDVKPRMP